MDLSQTLTWVTDADMGLRDSSEIVHILSALPLTALIRAPHWVLVHVHVEGFRQIVSASLLDVLSNAREFVELFVVGWLILVQDFVIRFLHLLVGK